MGIQVDLQQGFQKCSFYPVKSLYTREQINGRNNTYSVRPHGLVKRVSDLCCPRASHAHKTTLPYTNNITLTPSQHRHRHQTHDGHLTKRQQSDPLSSERMAALGRKHCTARLARRSDEALGVRVSVARIAPSLLDLGRAALLRQGSAGEFTPTCRFLNWRAVLSQAAQCRLSVGRRDVAVCPRRPPANGYLGRPDSATLGSGLAGSRVVGRYLSRRALSLISPSSSTNPPQLRLEYDSHFWGRGGVAVRPLASHQGEPGSIPGGASEFHTWESCRVDAAGRRIFSGVFRFLRPRIPAPLRVHLASSIMKFKKIIVKYDRTAVHLQPRIIQKWSAAAAGCCATVQRAGGYQFESHPIPVTSSWLAVEDYTAGGGGGETQRRVTVRYLCPIFTVRTSQASQPASGGVCKNEDAAGTIAGGYQKEEEVASTSWRGGVARDSDHMLSASSLARLPLQRACRVGAPPYRVAFARCDTYFGRSSTPRCHFSSSITFSRTRLTDVLRRGYDTFSYRLFTINAVNLKLKLIPQVQEFPPNTAIFTTLLVYLEAANRSAADKRSSSKLLMKAVDFEGETTAIGTRSKHRRETGDPRENPRTNGIVRHDSHMRKSGVTRPGIEPGSPCLGGEQANRSATVSPIPMTYRLDSTVVCILEHHVFVHWLLLQRVASVTPHLPVWHSPLVPLQVCYWIRVVQAVSNELRSTCESRVPHVCRQCGVVRRVSRQVWAGGVKRAMAPYTGRDERSNQPLEPVPRSRVALTQINTGQLSCLRPPS
ncbi:hypothetical protein PR048_029577 [Dryococelus australis]|uniref:Uncharacterized protein n=1 Tax=Dryococelus australis TaxID=614101 RepID=A0ABQ9GGA7_9NEOP|nr:hypothetical protein PR048_029577 [Dryococelus australis]